MSEQGGSRPPLRVLRRTAYAFVGAGLAGVALVWLVMGQGLSGNALLLLLVLVPVGLVLLWGDRKPRPGEDPSKARRRRTIIIWIVVLVGGAAALIALSFGVFIVLLMLGVVSLFPNK